MSECVEGPNDLAYPADTSKNLPLQVVFENTATIQLVGFLRKQVQYPLQGIVDFVDSM